MVARVGGTLIPVAIVTSVANAQKLTPRDAVRRVIDDEIAASSARARSLDAKNPTAWRLVAVRGKMVADRLRDEAKRQGPPTDEEIAALSERHWVEVDRPPSIRVIHAIVLRPDKNPELVPEARRLAEQIRSAVVDVTSTEEFELKANQVPHSPLLNVKVEQLPAFIDSGWITEGGGRMDEAFARAAFAIPAIGATSPVTETQFGFHVIRALERIPEKRMPLETRRVAFMEEVIARRARSSYESTLKTLHDSTPIEVAPFAEQLMRSVTRDAPSSPSAP